jgi:hypothetical protein
MNFFNGIMYVLEQTWFYLSSAFEFFFGWLF